MPGSQDKDVVVHLGDKLGIVFCVVSNFHQGMEDCIAHGVLRGNVGWMVGIFQEIFHNVELVGAGGQGERKLT